MLKLKLQYFSHLIRRAHSLTKTLMLWKNEGRRRRGWQRRRRLDSIADSTDMSLSEPQETVKRREAWLLPSIGSQIQTQLSDWAAAHFDLQQIWWIKIFLFQNGGIWVLAESQWEHSFIWPQSLHLRSGLGEYSLVFKLLSCHHALDQRCYNPEIWLFWKPECWRHGDKGENFFFSLLQHRDCWQK